jgi:hypothetical protein
VSRPSPKVTTSPHAPRVALYPFDPKEHPAIERALESIRGKVDVPVVLPRYLPAGLQLHPTHPVYRINTRHPGYILWLDIPNRGDFYFQFGASAFDGCGAEIARPIEIHGQPALIATFGHDEASEVIWPATSDHPTGRYGIMGPLPARQIIALAESMPVLPGRGSQSSC